MNASEQRTVVLVIDDSLNSIRMINDVLEEAGMTVLVALEGAQALTITQSITPDVVLLDAIMPNMDGFEVCRRLKQIPELMDVPVIFMTGLSDTEHVVMGLNAGGVDYVTKPIREAELLARMQVHVANARLTHSVCSALDTAGQNVFAVDEQGVVLWATPQVKHLLKRVNSAFEEGGSAVLRDWLAHKPEGGHTLTLDNASESLTVEFLALVSHKEYLLRLSDAQKPSAAADALREKFALTARESDVLLWIANGKTNREIGQILEMSPRTVNKHLEQIFKKLYVENRTSAAAAAIRYLARP